MKHKRNRCLPYLVAVGLAACMIPTMAVSAVAAGADTTLFAEAHECAYDNGFCTCGTYEPAILVSEENYASLGLDSTRVGEYAIGNAGQLYWFASMVNGTSEVVTRNNEANAVLISDITVNEQVLDANGSLVEAELREWPMLGYYLNPKEQVAYDGAFDGNGKTVRGLYVNKTAQNYVGFIALSNAGGVYDLNIADSYFSGARCVGAVMGSSNVPIARVTVDARVEGIREVGGVVGRTIAGVSNVAVYGTVTGTLGQVGGICGYNYTGGSVLSSYSDATVTGETYVGGVVGQNAATIEYCVYRRHAVMDTVGVYQHGIGTYTAGSFAEDIDGVTADVPSFATGEAAWLLNRKTADSVTWYQRLTDDAYPVLDTSHGRVWFGYADCNSAVKTGSNEIRYETLPSHTYVDNTCTVCGATHDGVAADVAAQSITLGEAIGLHVDMTLDDMVLADPDAMVVFTIPAGPHTREVVLPVAEAERVTLSDGTDGYRFVCRVAAKEMSSAIRIKVVTSNGLVSREYVTSVMAYAKALIDDPNTDVSEVSALKAMLNYGTAAQVYFDHKTDELANSVLEEADRTLETDIDLSAYSAVVTDEDVALSFAGSKLTLDGNIAIKLYFAIAEGAAIEQYIFAVNGQTVTPVQDGNYWRVDITDIPLEALDHAYAVTAGELTVDYSVISYAAQVLALDHANYTYLQQTMAALYAYWRAADVCGNQ